MNNPNFAGRKWFPGTTGGPFHILIEFAQRIERLPWPVFAVLLLVTAVIPSRGDRGPGRRPCLDSSWPTGR